MTFFCRKMLPMQICIKLMFLNAFDNTNNLLKPSSDIWINSEHKLIWHKSLKLSQQTFVYFDLEN